MNEAQSSVAPNNQFTFHCPTVDRAARYVVCSFKIAKNMRGEDFQDQDCRCAMSGGKCPAMRMKKKEYREDIRHYFSASADVKPCPSDIKTEINNIILLPFHAHGLNLTDQNKMTLFGSVVSTSRSAVLENEPTKSVEPKLSRKPKSSAGSSRDVNDEIVGGLASARVNVAEILNTSINEG
jgi:hypothetical protein